MVALKFLAENSNIDRSILTSIDCLFRYLWSENGPLLEVLLFIAFSLKGVESQTGFKIHLWKWRLRGETRIQVCLT